MNLQKFYMGECFDAYEYFGAHTESEGIVFRTYAPAAQKISVIGEFSGWNDTLKYLEYHPDDRGNMPEKITFSIWYAFQERYILPFSHDEVVHGKKTIIDKINGSYTEKFSQAKVLYLYMFTHPGKKLNFMGNELGMFREWDEKREPDWNLLKMPAHDSFHLYMMTLNDMYLRYRTLWALDTTYDGFKWVDLHSNNKSVFAYIRTDGKQHFLTILNFSGQDARINVDYMKGFLLLDTNWDKFGGNQPVCHKRSLPNTIGCFSGQFYRLRD